MLAHYIWYYYLLLVAYGVNLAHTDITDGGVSITTASTNATVGNSVLC